MKKMEFLITVAVILGICTIATTVIINERQPIIEQVVEVQTVYQNVYVVNNDFSESELGILYDVFMHLRSSHHFYSEADDLIRGAMEGMISATDDPWGRIWATTEFDRMQTGNFQGLGIFSYEADGYFVIRSIMPDSPAENYGLLAYDAILLVDGVNPLKWSEFGEPGSILGEVGSVAVLSIQRGDDILEMSVTRGALHSAGVVSEILEYNDQMIGYIRISNWQSRTGDYFRDSFRELQANEINGLVIDLRNNNGGLVDPVWELLSLFSPNTTHVLDFVESDGSRQEFRTTSLSARPGRVVVDVEGVILVNEVTASASEMFTIGMLEAGGWEVIGTTTFGKGTIQNSSFDFGGYMLWQTGTEVFGPTGTRIERYGITPTIYVEPSDFASFQPLHLGAGVVLSYDTVDDRTSRAQIILDLLGYEINRTDGYFDNSTVLALQSFQQNNGLTVTGNLNAETATTLSRLLLEKQQNLLYDAQMLAALRFLITGERY